MIPITFASLPIAAAAKEKQKVGGGACFLDVDGDGVADLILPSSGDQAIRVYRNNGGTFTNIDTKDTGLAASGEAWHVPLETSTMTVCPTLPLRSLIA